MSKKTPWIFVDCEARGTSPVHGVLTEFGAVHYDTRDTFHGRLFDATPDPVNGVLIYPGRGGSSGRVKPRVPLPIVVAGAAPVPHEEPVFVRLV